MCSNYEFIFYTDAFYLSTSVDNNLYVNQDGDCNGTWLPTTGILANEALFSNIHIAPSPVPNGWVNGFIGVATGLVYYSETGDTWERVLTEAPNSMQAWAVAWNDITQQWLVKFGDMGTNSDDGHDVYTATATPGNPPTWSQLTGTGLTAKDDYSLGVCNTNNATVFVARYAQGMAVTSDSGIDWKITQPSSAEDAIDEFTNMACSGSRCVAIVDDDEFWESDECSTGWANAAPSTYEEAIDTFPIIFPVDDGKGNVVDHFLVGSADGALFTSAVSGVWDQAGANQAQVSTFENCDDLVWTGNSFLATCYRNVLHSSDGRAWTSLDYDLNDDDEQLTEPTPGEGGFIVARSGKHYLSYSADYGMSWDYLITLWLYDSDDDFDIGTGMSYVNNHWLVNGDDKDPSTEEHFPLVIVSNEAGDQWGVYAPNYWLLDFVYSPELEHYVAGGQGGVYKSRDYYNWEMISQVNGECGHIATDENGNIVAVCSNHNSLTDTQDTVVVSSSDGGSTWTNYMSPCTTSSRSNIGILCDNVAYMQEMDLFVTFDESPTGMAYASRDAGESWSQISVPYAVKFEEFANGGDLLASLTSDTLFSGDSAYTVLLTNNNAGVYQGNTTNSAPPPSYPYYGLLRTFPQSSSGSGSGSSGDDGLTGGGIFGIVVACLVAVVLLAVIVFLIVAALFIYSRRRTSAVGEASQLLSNDEAL